MYQNESNGFTVFRLESAREKDGQHTVIGELAVSVSLGTNVIARGRWVNHPRFGRQFRARAITESEPTTRETILEYLGSGVVKGLGPVLAGRIVEVFGEDTLRVMDQTPERLRDIPGIGERKLEEICKAWTEKRNVREVLLFFQQYDIPVGLAQRIYRSYGERAIEIVRENPYLLVRSVWGIGFLTADRIARSLGIAEDSQLRIRAGIEYALRRANDDGHCYLPREKLLAKVLQLLQLESNSTVEIEHVLEQSIIHGELTRRDESIYLPTLERAEQELAEYLSSRLANSSALSPHIERRAVSEFAGQYFSPISQSSSEQGSTASLSPEQREALFLAAEKPLTVITGGPGCGKTTVVRAISAFFRGLGLSVKLTAPTGRAAQRLAEVCDMEAATIHRLLRFDPGERTFFHDQAEPLAADVVIVDESSMIDLQLATSLLSAIPKNARLIIVGDADQLPSVGPGRFLGDLLQIPAVPRVRLTTLFRRREDSLITHLAYQVNIGVMPQIPEPGGPVRSDAYFIPATEPAQAAELVERLVVEQIPKSFGFVPRQITVLTPMNRGELGIIALNNRLQARLVKQSPDVPTVRVGLTQFHLSDRVCQRVNNYQLTTGGVFNGDQGEIIGIDPENQSVMVQLWDGREVEYSSDVLYQLDLAYALTIHRSQGSEVPVIVLVVHESHTVILERQLIYTAITRAKQLLVIVGSKRALALAIKRTRGSRRFTALAERCVALLSEQQ